MKGEDAMNAATTTADFITVAVEEGIATIALIGRKR